MLFCFIGKGLLWGYPSVTINIFNDWYARDTSKKIRAVFKAKGQSGKPLSTNPPYGYVKDPSDHEKWYIDEPAADVVRRIYDLCLSGHGPLQIAKQLESEQILVPSAYYQSVGRKSRNKECLPGCL